MGTPWGLVPASKVCFMSKGVKTTEIYQHLIGDFADGRSHKFLHSTLPLTYKNQAHGQNLILIGRLFFCQETVMASAV
jgi:hypothetical protein